MVQDNPQLLQVRSVYASIMPPVSWWVWQLLAAESCTTETMLTQSIRPRCTTNVSLPRSSCPLLHFSQPMLQELGRHNPQLLALINSHQAEFLQLLNEAPSER